MSTGEKPPGRREHVILYGVVAVLLVVVMVAGVAAWRRGEQTREAEQKADRLVAALEELSARTPDREQIVRVLGTDGGPVCADPTGALNRAVRLAEMSNGAGGPGTRPVIADSKVVQGELAIIAVYCPDRLSDFEEFVDDLRTAELTGD